MRRVLVADRDVADYFEAVVAGQPRARAEAVANWIAGELFRLMNARGVGIDAVIVTPVALAELLGLDEPARSI